MILPLTPDRAIGPYEVVNPRTIWKLAVLFMAISGAGYIALRALGPRTGYPSPASPPGSSRARRRSEPWARARRRARHCAPPRSRRPFCPRSRLSCRWPSCCGGDEPAGPSRPCVGRCCSRLAAAVYALVFAIRGARSRGGDSSERGRPFRLWVALVFALTIGAVTIASALIHRFLGERGVLPSPRPPADSRTRTPPRSASHLSSRPASSRPRRPCCRFSRPSRPTR